ncbi:hypothetical protein SAMN05444483_10220 [Salegentibacter echinorum]|uniref:HNH endonuclease n=1 Tax=Salegentibacter echinorum TaxID=1073325 RepID=A0A1M5DLS8_SALEC|nr:hypothetical protein [Salegentibacter echinorum]SHF67959.1 hypothetical protein SAMN05444483_10220 [Salegentibacter echinorum]
MINLRPLETCSHYEFDQIHRSKNDPTFSKLSSIRNEIRERYNEYHKYFDNNNLEKLSDSPFVGGKKDALKHCYESPVKALNNLKIRIKKNQPDLIKGICQFCGMDSDNTFDHYLPKEDFPEFNINHRNLIPCCYTCNQLKNEYWLDNKNKRGIINLYTDTIPLSQFLFIDIKIINGLPIGVYSIKNGEGKVDKALYKVIKDHFHRLKLIERYNERFSNTFFKIINSIKYIIRAGLPSSQIEFFLKEEVNNDIHDFGVNHHITTTKKHIYENKELFKKIIQIYR